MAEQFIDPGYYNQNKYNTYNEYANFKYGNMQNAPTGQTTGGTLLYNTAIPGVSSATPNTFYNYVPEPAQLKEGNVVLYGGNVTAQNPTIQNLAKSGMVKEYADANGKTLGVQMLKPYSDPNAVPIPNDESLKNDLLNTQNRALGIGMETTNNSLPSYTDPNSEFIRSLFQTSNLDEQSQIAGVEGQKKTNLDLLKQQYDTEIQRINEDTGRAIQDINSKAGASNMSLKRILARGGALSGSTTGAMAVTALDNAYQSQITKLNQTAERLKSDTWSALLSGNAKVAAEAQKAMDEIKKSVADAQQNRIDNMLKYMTFQQNQQQLQTNTQLDILKTIQDTPIGQSFVINGVSYTGLKQPTKDTQLIKNEMTGDSMLIDTQTGETISVIKGTGATTEQNMVLDMANKYQDAGILPTDTLSQASSKLKNSRIYQDQVRGPVGSGGGKRIDQELREDVVSLSEEIQAGSLTQEQAFNRLRTLYSLDEVSDETIKRYLSQATGTEYQPQNIEEMAQSWLSLEDQGLGVWGTGKTTVGGATGAVLKEIPGVMTGVFDSILAGNKRAWDEFGNLITGK